MIVTNRIRLNHHRWIRLDHYRVVQAFVGNSYDRKPVVETIVAGDVAVIPVVISVKISIIVHP